MSKPTIAPIMDFDQFKCKLCYKYLSVPPIHMYTDSSNQGSNICGRCTVPRGAKVSRNVAFEAVAKHLEFPCSNAKVCRAKLRWGEVLKHEDECSYRGVECTICCGHYPVSKIVPHFEAQHRKQLFYDCVLVTGEETVGRPKSSGSFLMVTSKEPYFVFTEANRVLLTSNIILNVKVRPLTESVIPRTFSVTFSGDNHSVVFRNKQIKRYDDVDEWVSHIFNLTSIKNLFLPDEGDLKIELQIQRAPKKGGSSAKKTTNERNALEDRSSFLERLAEDAECPVCTAIMKTNIVVCRRGHSICEPCKNSCSTVCPICRSPFAVQRNFALEEISKKLSNFVV